MCIRLPLLIGMLGLELINVDLEEVDQFLRMLPSDVMESAGRDVICLAFSHQGIIFKQVLDF